MPCHICHMFHYIAYSVHFFKIGSQLQSKNLPTTQFCFSSSYYLATTLESFFAMDYLYFQLIWVWKFHFSLQIWCICISNDVLRNIFPERNNVNYLTIFLDYKLNFWGLHSYINIDHPYRNWTTLIILSLLVLRF